MSEFRKYLLALLSAATLFSASGCTKKKPEPTPTPTIKPSSSKGGCNAFTGIFALAVLALIPSVRRKRH